MLKFLTVLLTLFADVLAIFRAKKVRQETIKEMNDDINRQIQMGEAAVNVPDPVRDERLRNRFDRSRATQ